MGRTPLLAITIWATLWGCTDTDTRRTSAAEPSELAGALTGLNPQTHGVSFDGKSSGLRLRDEAVTLAERFSDAGHVSALFTQNPFAGRYFGLEQGFDRFEEHRTDGSGMTDAVLAHLAAPWSGRACDPGLHRRPGPDPDRAVRPGPRPG